MDTLEKDGIYTVEVSLNGGSGKASITTPAEITVENGKMTLKVEWSSSKYDLMIVGGENYYPVNTEGNSQFLIPLSSVGEPLSVQAETVAMSEPHLIDYEIVFDASTVRAQGGVSVPVIVGCAAAVLCAAAVAAVIAVIRKKKNA